MDKKHFSHHLEKDPGAPKNQPSKPHIHGHKRNMGEQIVGLPDDTIKKLLVSESEFDWFVDKTINEGPIAKQVRNALLLKGISALVRVVTEVSGKEPMPFKGYEIESDSPEDIDYTYPVQLLEEVLHSFNNKEEILYWINEGPPHDVLKDILVLSLINWISKALSK